MEGKIDEVKEIKTKTGKPMFIIHMGGKKYSGFTEQMNGCKEGDTVNFNYKQNGDYLNITGKLTKVAGTITPTEISVSPAAQVGSKDSQIRFLALLKAAATLISGVEGIPSTDEAVWNIAKKWDEQGKNEGRW